MELKDGNSEGEGVWPTNKQGEGHGLTAFRVPCTGKARSLKGCCKMGVAQYV
jgi:hypothetical protein